MNMDCRSAREAIDAHPADSKVAVTDHLATCAECSTYAADARAFDERLRRVLEVPVPQRGTHRGPYAVTTTPEAAAMHLPRRRPRLATRRLALAASLAGATVLAGLLWVGVPRESLAQAVAEHMSEEPDAWTATAPVAPGTLDRILARAGIHMVPGAPDVTYAQPCTLRGRLAPHLIVHTLGGPVTVMVLPDEPVRARTRFESDGYRGILLPAPRGALAVLVPVAEADTDVESVAERVLASLRYETA